MAAPSTDVISKAVMTIATMVIGASGSVVWFWIQGYFDSKKDKIRAAEDGVKALHKDLKDVREDLVSAILQLKEASSVAYGQLKDRISEVDRDTIKRLSDLSTRVEVLSTNLDQHRKEFVKVEGRIELHAKAAEAHTAILGGMTDKLGAILEDLGPATQRRSKD
jgi:septation ring formation regulator EzrA